MVREPKWESPETIGTDTKLVNPGKVAEHDNPVEEKAYKPRDIQSGSYVAEEGKQGI